MHTLSTDEPHRHLVIDGGKSKTAAIVIDSTGSVIAQATGPGLEMIGSPNGPELVAASLRATLAAFDLGSPFDTVCFDLNGVQAPSTGASLALAAVSTLVRARRYVVASDAIMSYIGALGFRPGVLAAVGTGSVIQAVSRDDHLYRIDAYGPLLGDRGSGYQVGRRGLVNAFSVADGLAGSKILHDQMLERFGGVEPAMKAVYGDINPSKVIASFSREVAVAAAQGDPDAIGIWRRAGQDLARGVAAAAEQASLQLAPFDVACAGGLFGVGALLSGPFEEELREASPFANIRPANGGALDGGVVLALTPHPVWPEVSLWSEQPVAG